MCGMTDVGCSIKEGFASMVTNQFDILSDKLGELAVSGLEAVSTFWIKNPAVQPDPIATQHGTGWTASEPVAFLHGSTLALAATIFVIAVIIAGLRTAWEQRGEPLRELLKATLILVLVAGAGSAVIQLLVEISDGIAWAIIDKARPQDTELGDVVGKAVFDGISLSRATADLPLVAGMFFGVAIFMASVVQVVLLLIRSAMLVLLAGTFPLAAAATNTEVGKAWFRKYCGWVLAFVAYKPAAALVYAAAIKMTDAGVRESGNTLVNAMGGLMMMLLAVFALPALLRLVVPVTAAVAGGGAGSGASLADPGGLATGAINAGRGSLAGRSGGGGGGGGGHSGGGGGGGGGFKGVAAGAIGVGAAASGAALSGTKKAGGALAGAASHSAGEAGGGASSGSSGSGGGGRGWSSSRRPQKPTKNSSTPSTPQQAGPSGSQR